ncbi:MAG TPA: hypothetical protein VNO17_05020 [Actinomycetota bacterium]|nr:hypothetical protein [Actinomycetota bacterium]
MREEREAPSPQRCARCGRPVEECAFCEREACREPICSRCLRIHLREALAEPHVHGG